MSSLSGLTFPLVVKEKIQETHDSASLVLSIPEEHKERFSYQAGQFISFDLNINGENLRRSYSLCTSPLCDSQFKVTIKRVPQGRGSNFLLDQVHAGDTVQVTPPAGLFFRQDEATTPKHYLLFAAGSGITPIFSILKTALHLNEQNKVTLLFANRSEKDIIYKQEVAEWEKNFEGRLKVIHLLSKPESGWGGLSGRIQEKVVQAVLESCTDINNADCYICGPEGFMEATKTTLSTQNIQPEQIHIESFVSPAEIKKDTVTPQSDWILIGDQQADKEDPDEFEVVLNGEKTKIPYKDKDLSLLEAIIDAGVNAPYSCMDGACMACLGKVSSGLVYQEDMCILSDDNINDKETLTCQCRPISTQTVIDFDEV